MSSTSSISSELVRYSNSALATGALHQVSVCNKAELKSIHQALPQDAEAVVRFLVAADYDKEANTTIYHAATVHFKKSKGLKVSATLATYVDGKYQEKTDRKALLEPSSVEKESNALVEAHTELFIRKYPLITKVHEKHLQGMKAKERCPEALAVAQAVKNIFKDGVPLPNDQSLHYCTFEVMFLGLDPKSRIHINSDFHISRIQQIQLNSGTRGTQDGKCVNSSWQSIGVRDAVSTQTRDFEELNSRFDQIKAGAQGKKLALDIPSSARPIARGTMKEQIEDGSVSQRISAASSSSSLIPQ